MKYKQVKVVDLSESDSNPRKHSKAQIEKIAESIKRFGFTQPIVIATDGEVVAGHGRLMAAKRLKMTEVPTVELSGLSKQELMAYMIADNKIAEMSEWDYDDLADVLEEISREVDFTGFDDEEIEALLAKETRTTEKTEKIAAIKKTRILLTVETEDVTEELNEKINELTRLNVEVDYGGN